MFMSFDVEHLQKLAYERSKSWANFLEKVVNRETLCEIDINEVDKEYLGWDENDSHDELASMEDEDCNEIDLDTEFLQNVSNTTRLSLMFNNKTLALAHNNTCGEQNQLIDIFNQTLPVINEHNRQLKEYGLDKVLISFDKKQIEEKVGSWLNRHNSLYGGDNTILFNDSKSKGNTTIAQQSSGYLADKYNTNKNSITIDVSCESDDSLQSGETARYIRSSKAGGIKTRAARTTMIKTYRMVKSSREALREKYAFGMDNDDCYLRSVRQCRRIVHNIPRKYDITPLTTRKGRRKVLRKRTSSNSCSTVETSSGSDYCYEDYRRCRRKSSNRCCIAKYNNYSPLIAASSSKMCKTQRTAMKITSTRRSRIYYYSHSKAKPLRTSTSSSSNSFRRLTEESLPLKIKAIDNRACKRESECYCCSETKLCDDFKHFADSSTEENWLVENCCSPEKFDDISNSKSTKTMASQIEQPKATAKNLQKELRPKNKLSEKRLENLPNGNVLINESRCGPKTSKIFKEKKSAKDKSSVSSDSSDLDIKKTILASIESYKRETENRARSEMNQKQTKGEILKSKNSRKIAKIKEKEDLKFVQTTPKKIPKLTEECNNEQNIKYLFAKGSKMSGSDTTANMEIFMPNKTENIFSTTSRDFCNSTALSSVSPAYNKQIYEKSLAHENEVGVAENKKKGKKLQKLKNLTILEEEEQMATVAANISVTSITMRPLEINVPLSSNQFVDLNNEMNSDDNSDCALVTSTTNIEQLQQNDILIYGPHMDTTNNSKINDDITITTNHMAKAIGEKQAKYFMKYYIGTKRFNRNALVYYRAPRNTSLIDHNNTSSSDSGDELDNIGQCGYLYILNK